MAEATVNGRKDQIEMLKEQLIKDNKKLFNKNADQFKKLSDSFSKDISGLNPMAQEQVGVLKDIANDARLERGDQKKLLADTKTSLSVLKSMKNVDSANEEQIRQLIVQGNRQESLLTQNVERSKILSNAIEKVGQTITSGLSDTMAIGLGLISESPLLAVGVKGIMDAATGIGSKIMETREDSKSKKAEDLEASRDNLLEAMDGLSSDMQDNSESVLEPLEPEDMQSEFIEGFKEGMEEALNEVGMTMADLEKVLGNKFEPIDMPDPTETTGIERAIDNSSIEEQDWLEQQTGLMFKQSDFLDDIQTDMAQTKWMSVAQLESAQTLFKWLAGKAATKSDVVNKGLMKVQELQNKLTNEGNEMLQKAFEKAVSFGNEKLGLEIDEPLQISDQLGQSLDDLGYLAIERNDLLGEMKDLMWETEARADMADSRAEEESREAAERHRDMLEVMKQNNKGEMVPASEEKGFLEKLMDFLPGGLGLGVGALSGAAIASALGMGALLALLGGALYVIGKGALEHLVDNPGDYLGAAMEGFADLGNLLMDGVNSIGELFGLNEGWFNKETRQKAVNDAIFAVDEWFTNLSKSVTQFFEDVIPEDIQEKLGIGKFADSQDVQQLKREAFNLNEDGTTTVNLNALAQLPADELEEFIKGRVKVHAGATDLTGLVDLKSDYDLGEDAKGILADIRDKKLEIDDTSDPLERSKLQDELSQMKLKAGTLMIPAPPGFWESFKGYFQRIEAEDAPMRRDYEYADQVPNRLNDGMDKAKEVKEQTEKTGMGAGGINTVVGGTQVSNNNQSSSTTNVFNEKDTPIDHDPAGQMLWHRVAGQPG